MVANHTPNINVINLHADPHKHKDPGSYVRRPRHFDPCVIICNLPEVISRYPFGKNPVALRRSSFYRTITPFWMKDFTL